MRAAISPISYFLCRYRRVVLAFGRGFEALNTTSRWEIGQFTGRINGLGLRVGGNEYLYRFLVTNEDLIKSA